MSAYLGAPSDGRPSAGAHKRASSHQGIPHRTPKRSKPSTIDLTTLLDDIQAGVPASNSLARVIADRRMLPEPERLIDAEEMGIVTESEGRMLVER